MYNLELKRKFVEYYTTSISTTNNCDVIFNQFEEFERAKNKDLCEMSTDELQPIMDEMLGVRARSKYVKIIILRDYVRWCINVEKVPNACDGIFHVNTVGLDIIRQRMVASPLHLQRYLDRIFSPESDKTIDNVYRCYFWLAFSGIYERDVLSIKRSDVDLASMTINYKGMDIPIYRESLQVFRNCVELTQFSYIHPNYSTPILRDRVPGNTIMRGVKSVQSLQTIKSKTSEMLGDKESEIGVRLSYRRALMSGLFYRTYEREMTGEEPNFSYIVDIETEGKTYKLDSGRNTVEAKKRQMARDYLEDYERWKLAFKF